jgi:hypothetical protein
MLPTGPVLPALSAQLGEEPGVNQQTLGLAATFAAHPKPVITPIGFTVMNRTPFEGDARTDSTR